MSNRDETITAETKWSTNLELWPLRWQRSTPHCSRHEVLEDFIQIFPSFTHVVLESQYFVVSYWANGLSNDAFASALLAVAL